MPPALTPETVRRIHDLGSANGTYVNGVRAAIADLRSGDEVRPGEIVVCVR